MLATEVDTKALIESSRLHVISALDGFSTNCCITCYPLVAFSFSDGQQIPLSVSSVKALKKPECICSGTVPKSKTGLVCRDEFIATLHIVLMQFVCFFSQKNLLFLAVKKTWSLIEYRICVLLQLNATSSSQNCQP